VSRAAWGRLGRRVVVDIGYRTARGETGSIRCETSDRGVCSVGHRVAPRESSVTFTVTGLDGAAPDEPRSVTVVKP
jgi:hypothetical protein